MRGYGDPIMPASLRNKKKLVILFGIALLVILAVSFLPTVYAWWVGPERQGITLRIRLIDSNGEAVPYALVRVFLLTDHGPVLLASSGTYRCGEAALHVFVPRVGNGFMLVPVRVDNSGGAGKPTYTLITDFRKPIYASINLEIFAVDLSPKGKMAGVKVFSMDPTYMKWPEDSISITVKMRKILIPVNSLGINEDKVLWRPRKIKPSITSDVSWWQYTPILKYGTWDGIKEWFVFNTGSKIEIESKDRVCVMDCEPWRSAGSTQVTVDSYLKGKPISGELVRTLYVKIKYVDYTYCDTFFGICEETIYAADTDTDFPSYKYLDQSWNGHLPSSPYVYYTYPGDTRGIKILGGYHWDLSVTVGVNIGEEPSVTLGITFVKVPNPVSYLYIEGEEGYGNRIKTVSIHGTGEGSYVVTYSNWVG